MYIRKTLLTNNNWKATSAVKWAATMSHPSNFIYHCSKVIWKWGKKKIYDQNLSQMETRATGVQLNKITVALPLSNTQKLLNWINRKRIARNTILAIHPPDENWIEQKQKRKSWGNNYDLINSSLWREKEGRDSKRSFNR